MKECITSKCFNFFYDDRVLYQLWQILDFIENFVDTKPAIEI